MEEKVKDKRRQKNLLSFVLLPQVEQRISSGELYWLLVRSYLAHCKNLNTIMLRSEVEFWVNVAFS